MQYEIGNRLEGETQTKQTTTDDDSEIVYKDDDLTKKTPITVEWKKRKKICKNLDFILKK